MEPVEVAANKADIFFIYLKSKAIIHQPTSFFSSLSKC